MRGKYEVQANHMCASLQGTVELGYHSRGLEHEKRELRDYPKKLFFLGNSLAKYTCSMPATGFDDSDHV
jgi:hypothetical protein